MCNGAEINLVDGFNDLKFHETLIQNYSEMIPLVADAGYTNLICFSGSRRNKLMKKVGIIVFLVYKTNSVS
jgi:hydroxypyruvate isomerase